MLTILILALVLIVCLPELAWAAPMGTAFSYQGRLMDKNKPADGLYDFQFRLYDSNDPCTGTQLTSPIDINDLDVIDGHFVVELDFGSVIFDGDAVWLETRVVRSPMGSDPATLSPLLELTPTPYAIYSQEATDLTLPYSGMASSGAAAFSVTNTGSGTGVYGEHTNSGNYGRLGTIADGVFGQSSASGGSGVAGVNTGVGNGVYGRSNDGKGVHGVSSNGFAGYFNGDVTLTKPAGLGGGELVLRTATYNEPGRYRIRFENNGLGVFTGDDMQNQQFSFVSKWGAIRDYDARLTIHGKASGSWGTYIALTHDGDDGLIETDVGDIVLSPAGNVGIGTTTPSTKLDVAGTVNATAFVGDGSGLTGIAGDSDWTISGNDMYSAVSGNVGIGTTTPWTKLTLSGGGFSVDYSHKNDNSPTIHVENCNDGTCFGVSTATWGIWSAATSDGTERKYGVAGLAGGNDGDKRGLYGGAQGRGTNYGVRGEASCFTGVNDNYGVYGSAGGSYSGTNNYGVYGYAAGSSGNNYGVYGYGGGGSPNWAGYFDGNVFAQGNVGIGTTSPTGKVDIRGDEVRIWDGSANVGWAISQGELYVERDLEVDGRIFVLDAFNTGVSGRDVYVASNGELGFVTSSKRYKENIAPLKDDFSKMLQAQPVTFTAKESKERSLGFIAEDMDELGLSNLVLYDAQGRPESVRYDWISLYLLEILKDQDESIKDLRAENESLEQRLEVLERTVQQLTQGKEFEL